MCGNSCVTSCIHNRATKEATERNAELERVNAELRRDADRIDWMAAHPLEALDIFGDIKRGEERFVRKIIDAAIASEKENERG